MSEDNNTVVTLKVRVTPEFREKIIDAAKENSRSMNAEIVHRLDQSFNNSPEKQELMSVMSNLLTRLERLEKNQGE